MIRRQIFLDPKTGLQLTLPMTPASYRWEHGINLETVNIDGLGDVSLAGHGTLDSEKIECMFPSHFYPWLEPGTSTNPFRYIEQLEKWIDGKTVLRYMISGTPTNAPVRIESILYEEKDGTNDVYATITIKQHRAIPPVSAATVAGVANSGVSLGGGTRGSETAAVTPQSYQVKRGDTLSAIARKFYGDPGKYPVLAAANGLKNPHLIFAGTVLTIPPKG